MSTFQLSDITPSQAARLDRAFRVIKREVIVAPKAVFDAQLCLLETRNFARIAEIHLSRCNDPHTAKEIHTILDRLSKGFEKKI
jgi:hypothetical protein